VSGLAAAIFAKSILLSDYTPKILQILKENVKANSETYVELKKKIKIVSLDWLNDKVPEPLSYDVVIGTEVVYDVKLVPSLANVIYNALNKNGDFYGVSAAVRQGIPDFITCMKKLRFKMVVSSFPKHLLPDTKLEYGSNDCLFFECKKT